MDEIAQFPVRKNRHKQAAAFERERFKGKNRKTKLAALLLEKWVWGQLNATLLQKVAEAAAQDLKDIFDENIEEWDVLAKCGSSLVFTIKVFIFQFVAQHCFFHFFQNILSNLQAMGEISRISNGIYCQSYLLLCSTQL